MKNIAAIASLMVILTGCAEQPPPSPSVAQYQSYCLSQPQKFSAQFDCISQGAYSDPARRTNPLVNEYVLYGQKLVQDVGRRKMSETDARLALVQKFNELVATEKQQKSMTIHDWAVAQQGVPLEQYHNPIQTYNTPPLRLPTNCNSMVIGNQVNTSCY